MIRLITASVAVLFASLPAAAAFDTPRPAAAAAKQPFSIDAAYAAHFEHDYTTQFPSRWANQQSGTAWRTAHDAAAIYIRDEWRRLLKPFEAEGAFAELRPFNFVDPTGAQPDNQAPGQSAGPENNVLAFMPGADPVLRNQVVIIGGHYDCVDVTVDGGIDCGMQIPVTSAVVEALVRYWTENNLRPRRSLAFFAIDGEEQCLCGSVQFTTAGSVNALAHHLELPPELSVVAYHDTDMIGLNYPNRLFGLSSNDFMVMNVFAAPTVDDATRALAPFAAYYPAIANPGFLAKFKLYRQALLRQRDRFFADMHAKYPTWTYRDGVTLPLFTPEQKKYVNIVDDPLNRSDHTVFIAEGIPGELNIGLSDVEVAPPGLLAYHNVGETQEELNYHRGGEMTLNRDSLLGYEATSMWVAYTAGAGEDAPAGDLFMMGETPAVRGMAPISGVRLERETAVLPAMPPSQAGDRWRRLGSENTIVRGLTVDPQDPRTLYLASQDRGFLVSRDGGRTFDVSNAGLGPFTSLWSVAAQPNGVLWAATHHGGVFRSDDGGATWKGTRGAASSTAADVVYDEPDNPVTSTELLGSNIEVNQERAVPGGVWLYGFDQCLAQFAPEGQECATRADWPAEGFDRHDMTLHYYRYASDVVAADDGSVVSSGFATPMTGGGTFRTEDAGATWSYTWPAATGAATNLWRLAKAGPSRMFAAGTGGVFVSEDAGRKWTRTSLASREIRALTAHPSDAAVAFAGSWDANGGVFKTTDGGGTWTRTSNGLPGRAGIAAIAIDPTNSQRMAAATYWYGVYLSDDGGSTWRVAADAMPDEVRQRLDDVDFASDGTLYASSHHGVWAMGGPAASAETGQPIGDGGAHPATGLARGGAAVVALLLAAVLGLIGLRSRSPAPAGRVVTNTALPGSPGAS